MEFNFKGLHPAFLEAINRHEPSIAFTLADGRGRFVFLLFIATSSSGRIQWGELELFVLLARTQRMLRFRLYGNQKLQGDFRVYLKESDEEAIREELGLQHAGRGPQFVLQDLLARLDAMIPASVPINAKIDCIQDNRDAIRANCGAHIDDATKVYLLRAAPLPEGKHPREETLRKLYMLDAPTNDIAALIANLKRIRWTTYWTATPPATDAFARVFEKVATSLASR